MKNTVIAFKKNRALVYIDDQKGTHFVPNANWDLYMAHRKETPKLCKIYDRVSDCYTAAGA